MPTPFPFEEHELLDADYFDLEARPRKPRVFDESLLQEPLAVLRTNAPIVCAPDTSVTEAMRAMQSERRSCVLVSEDGTAETRLIGIFTERDVLLRIVDRGRNPATLPLREVMTSDPECLPVEASVAWVLNRMAIGGFCHVPVTDAVGRPVALVSVRDIVQFLVEFFPRHVLNLPPRFEAGGFRTREGA